MNSNSPTVYKSKTWYAPNELFYNFISNQSNARVIKGNDDGVSTLEFMDDKSKVTFSFHILYKLFKNDFNFSFVLLDETIFNLEKKFFAVDYDTVCDDYHVNLFLDDTKMFNQSNIDLLLEFFNKAMSNIQSHYKVTPSLLKLPSMKGVRSLRHLARKISEVTVFLHLDSLSKSIFKKRVIRNYYNQNMIFDLTIEEKLPELLYDTEHNDNVLAYLESSIETEIFNSGESVYRLSRKSMFRPLQKKRVCAPSIKLKYIDEFDDHNYIYYDKKEKWINIKDVLNQQFDDEYTSDVIYPRVKEIFNYEQVMKTPMSLDQFKTKYSLLFHLLEDVIPEDELMEKHKELFLYFPDPVYENKVVEEATTTPQQSSESKPEESEESKPTGEIEPSDEEKKPIVPVKSEPVEDRESVDGMSEASSSDDEDVSLPPLLSELNKAVEKSKKTPLSDEFNFDEIDSLKQNKKEVDSNKTEIITEGDEGKVDDGKVDDGGDCRDMCCKCKKRSKSECTSTFTHSSKNNKDVKCVTYCYDCLEKHQLDDH
jgi:hypothetical protein